jgi:hypothetical protein
MSDSAAVNPHMQTAIALPYEALKNRLTGFILSFMWRIDHAGRFRRGVNRPFCWNREG